MEEAVSTEPRPSEAILSRYLSQGSLVVAFQDCFALFALVFVAAAVARCCVPGGDADRL
jgi:hypothetical protein